MAITKILLSGGGTDGKPLQGSGGYQTIHTASSNATDIDEIWIWACNISAADGKIASNWGSSGTVTNQNIFTIPADSGLYLIIPGLVLKGNAGVPKIVNVETQNSGGGGAAGIINMVGYVNRHSV